MCHRIVVGRRVINRESRRRGKLLLVRMVVIYNATRDLVPLVALWGLSSRVFVGRKLVLRGVWIPITRTDGAVGRFVGMLCPVGSIFAKGDVMAEFVGGVRSWRC